MIDLHAHTFESDGSDSPEQLIARALAADLEALAITDHDTLKGYDTARPAAEAAGLDLVCGIELSTKYEGRTVHLLGYFLDGRPTAAFREWLNEMQASRRDRNIRLAQRLQELGLDITIEEAEKKGRSLTGRPHFAKLLIEKGYVQSYQQAFDDYLDESAKGYVQRQEPSLQEAIGRIRDGGGISSLAHPIRVTRDLQKLERLIDTSGLDAIETLHSDHTPEETTAYEALALRYGLKTTGGSDYHGEAKPKIGLGSVSVPRAVLDRLRS